jgi:hypothetical protein
LGRPVSSAATAPSRSLAFTGSSPGLRTVTLLGAALMLFGLLMLKLADIPRRVLRQVVYRGPGRRKARIIEGSQALARSVKQDLARGAGWFLGR